MNDNNQIKCGIIMPISEIDGCSKSHWIKVKNILFEIVELICYKCQLVSDDPDVGVIHKRIIKNVNKQ